MNGQRAPGSALLHPLAPLSLLILLLNDHWLKHAHPGFLSGKLSDFAAVFLLPVLLHAVFEMAHVFLCTRAPSISTSNRALALCVALTCVVFALPEVWKPAETAYCLALASLQWPFRALLALVAGHALPALRRVAATADITDLMALPSAYLAWRVARRGSSTAQPRSAGSAPVLFGALIAVASLGSTSRAAAAGSRPFEHDGLFMGFEAGPELMWLRSTASVSNGFRQPIASTATGLAAPGGSLELGGTLRALGLVLGGGIGYARIDNPIVSTLGQRFELRGSQLTLMNFQAFAKYYPDPKDGLHLGASLGALVLEDTRLGGRQLSGPSLSLEVGHGIWLARQWSFGAAARLTVAKLQGDFSGAAVLVMPGLFATIACH